MEKHDLFPFTFEDYADEDITESMLFINVTWTEAFGVFDQGEQLTDLRIRYDLAQMESVNIAGDVLKMQRFRAVPVEVEALVDIGGSD